MSWLIYSLAATVFLGISMAFWKIPTLKGYSSFFSTFWTNTLSSLFVLSYILISQSGNLQGIQKISWYGLAWGSCFAVNMVLMKLLLKDKEAGTVLPVTSSLGSLKSCDNIHWCRFSLRTCFWNSVFRNYNYYSFSIFIYPKGRISQA